MRAAFFHLLAIVLPLTAIVAPPTAHAQTYTVIHDFMGGADGNEPNYGLTIDASGNLYGTTFSGDLGTGTVYMLSPNNSTWVLTPLYMFTGGSDGAAPYAAVVFGPDGSLYGTTGFGGIPNPSCITGGGFTGCGTVFNLKNSTLQRGGAPSSFWTETVLYAFTGGSDGATPYGARLIFDAAGNLYGTTAGGGSTNCPGGCGLVYQLVPSNGAWTENVVYSFTGGTSDGASPWAGVILDQAGNLYGTTLLGGAYGFGTVFELTPSGSGWTEKVLYSFQNQNDGGKPYAGLIFDQAGNLYGATTVGGGNEGGTVFELTPSGTGWTFQTLYAFTGTPGQFAHGPTASLVLDNGGNLFGATAGDGAYGKGGVFKLTQSGGSWSYTSLYDFTGGNDGRTPRSNLVFDKYGNLYGTASGGQNDCDGSPCGVVFEITFPMQYIAATPCRGVDTRGPDGQFGGPPIQGGTYRDFSIPSSACSIPATAAAYSLNVTVVPTEPLNYLTVWPTGQTQPLVSTMNSVDGRVKANAAIVPAGNNGGSISIYASNTTNVVVDIDGYFVTPNSSTLAFYPATPCRVADTRNGQVLQGGQEADFQVSGLCNIPAAAQAYSLNMTAIPKGPLEYLTVWPQGQSQPYASTLNAPTGAITANAAIVTPGPTGQIAVYPTDNTDLVIDVNGYFAARGTPQALSLYTATPCRVLDTRQGSGAFSGELAVNVLGSVCEPPPTAQSYVLNATVVPQGRLVYLTLWADGADQPLVSTLNALDGKITSNMAIVPTTNGSIDAYASDPTQLILDIFGYFAP